MNTTLDHDVLTPIEAYNHAVNETLDKVLVSVRSDALEKLFAALSKAQSQMAGAVRDSTNPHFRSKYADLASCWDACRKPLTDNQLTILQPVKADGPSVTVTTILAHSSGQWMSESLTMTAGANSPQAIGSAITYGRRYGLCAMVGIASEDDDGEGATRPSGESSKASTVEEDRNVYMPAGLSAEGLPKGQVYLTKVAPGMGTAQGFIHHTGQTPKESGLAFYKDVSYESVTNWCAGGVPVKVDTKESASGKVYVTKITPMPTTDTVL